VETLEAQIATKTTSIATLEDEKEDLLDQRDELNQQLDAMENGQRERSISRVGDDEQLEQVRLLFLFSP